MDENFIILDFSLLISSFCQVKFHQYVAPSIQQTSVSGQDPMDADVPVSTDGVPDSELENNGRTVDLLIENHSNGGVTEMETGRNDDHVAPESDLDQVKMEEWSAQ